MDQTRPVRKLSNSSSSASVVVVVSTAPSVTTLGGSRQLQLPPLTSTTSDNEREAHIRNRHEQIRLIKLLDHIDVQERVFVQLFNKERHVIETTLTHVASTTSPISARCRHHRYQHRAHQLRQQQQQLRLRWEASAASGRAVQGGVQVSVPDPFGVSAVVAAAVVVAAKEDELGRSQSHSSPTLVDLDDNEDCRTSFEFVGADGSGELWKTQVNETKDERSSSLKVGSTDHLPRSFSLPETKCLACNMSSTTLLQHDERNTDSDGSEDDDDDDDMQITSNPSTGVADPTLSELLPIAPPTVPNFIIGDSRSSSLDSDDVSSTWLTDCQQQRQYHHEGPHLFRSSVGRPSSAVDCKHVLSRQSRVDDDDEPPTSVDDLEHCSNSTSVTSPRRLLARPRCDVAVPSIVVDFQPIADGDDECDGTASMSTVKRICEYTAKVDVVQGPNATLTPLQSNADRKPDQPPRNAYNDEQLTDRKQPLRSVSATQLTSLFVNGMTSFPPIEQQPTANDAAPAGVMTKRSAKKKNAYSRLNPNGSSCPVENTFNIIDATPLTPSTSTDRKSMDSSKRPNEKHSANLSLTSTRRTVAITRDPTSVRETSAEHEEFSGKKFQTMDGGPKQPDISRSKSVIHPSDRSPPTTIWRDAKFRRASMQLSVSDDPEMKLRKELRLLEKQRRLNEEQTAARRVDRAKAIASERSKYGSGLAPRLEQFFSRILRTQEPPELDRKKLEGQVADDVDDDDDDNETEEYLGGTGSCALAGRRSRMSLVSSADADEYLSSGWIDDDLESSGAFAVLRRDTSERFRKLDGNNNRGGCSEVVQ